MCRHRPGIVCHHTSLLIGSSLTFVQMQEEEDVAFEEDIIRNPYHLKSWLRYIEHKLTKKAPRQVCLHDINARNLSYSYSFDYCTHLLGINFPRMWHHSMYYSIRADSSQCLSLNGHLVFMSLLSFGSDREKETLLRIPAEPDKAYANQLQLSSCDSSLDL